MSNITLFDIATFHQKIVDSERGQLAPGKFSDKSQPFQAPWMAPPDGFFPFNTPGTIALPAIGSGFTDVVSFVVPNGYDGIIQSISNNYNGPGFVNGSGALIWRILQNGQAIRGYNNILVQFGVGSFPGAISGGIRIYSGDLIEFQVSNVSQVGAATQINCFLGGYCYPKKIQNG